MQETNSQTLELTPVQEVLLMLSGAMQENDRVMFDALLAGVKDRAPEVYTEVHRQLTQFYDFLREWKETAAGE